MSRTGRRGVVGVITRLREVWRELDYAQRRALELRTGLSFDNPLADRTPGAEIRKLEALYKLPPAPEDVAQRSAAAPAPEDVPQRSTAG